MKPPVASWRTAWALCCLGLALGAQADATRPGQADTVSDESEGWRFKLTPSYYRTGGEVSAQDVNLRANHGPHALWLGYYRRPGEFEQSRTGYEYTLELPHATLVPSLQLASHGVVGGSLNGQLGDDVFLLLGLGRTNAREYYNLNFDPNDATTLGFGLRPTPESKVAVYRIRDNRLHTEQVVDHLVLGWSLAASTRIVLDVFAKHGRAAPDEPVVSGHGSALTVDFRQYFLRLAQDRKVNFGPDDQIRLAIGWRF